MPFTTIALDRLIEPKVSRTMAAVKSGSDLRQGSRINGTDKPIDRHHWTQISPALYATPEPTPLPELPDSPSSFTPSPYIVNHKRRGPRLSKAFSEDEVALHGAVDDEKTNVIVRSLEAEDIESFKVNETDNVHEAIEDNHAKSVVNGGHANDITENAAAGQDNLESEVDDFFDPQDSLSVRSSVDGESSFGLERSFNLNNSVSEFYDAWEELSSESGSQPSSHVETELRELRLSLLVEMERRKQAEECINDMRSQWGRIREQLSLVGLNLPVGLTVLEDQSGDDPVEELSRQVHLMRFVSNSIGRGVAKAELETEMEARLESKNFEIARLLDKLRYYELVNHEMSQRNQETIETMRQRREKRKKRQRWIWGSVVAAVTIGSGVLAWSYGKGSSLADAPPCHTSEDSRSTQ
uniref:uncharacterized protein LOC122603453 n=1 Tax=Erigeron canadensis TaxID=72917 RepID=UPI001CB9C0FB|nr:uncharacterized protein LOC122603453 [Erigeron canadensis]